MSLKNMVLLFILYGGPGIAALLFLLLGFSMARTRFEVIATGLLVGVLIAVQAAELYFLFSLRRALDGDSDDPLVLAGVAIVLVAAALNWLFLARRLKRDAFSGDMR